MIGDGYHSCVQGWGDGEGRGDKDRQWVGVGVEGVRSSTCAIYGVILPCYGHRTVIMHIGQRVLDYYCILLKAVGKKLCQVYKSCRV